MTHTRRDLLRVVGTAAGLIPTTAAAFRGRLYLPNARFSTPVTPTTPYAVVGIST